jgi:hypothetical protein
MNSEGMDQEIGGHGSQARPMLSGECAGLIPGLEFECLISRNAIASFGGRGRVNDDTGESKGEPELRGTPGLHKRGCGF